MEVKGGSLLWVRAELGSEDTVGTKKDTGSAPEAYGPEEETGIN